MADPYATLQVPRNATTDEIKRSFRRLAKELHPDLNPGDAQRTRRFKEVTEAYDVLSDEAKRRQFDQGPAAQADRSAKPRGDFRAGAGAGFGGQNRQPPPRGGPRPQTSQERAAEAFLQGADIHHTLTITFIEATLGCQKRITLADQRTVEIPVPAQSQDGQVLRLRGQGGAGRFGGKPGDLLVDLLIEPHPTFQRRGLDIHMTLPVTVPEAILGASVVVATIHGPVQLHIPRGSNTDTILRLRGMGLSQAQGGSGDQYVTLKVVLPPESDPEFSKLVEVWAKRQPYRVRPI